MLEMYLGCCMVTSPEAGDWKNWKSAKTIHEEARWTFKYFIQWKAIRRLQLCSLEHRRLHLILVSFYWVMTIEFVLAELLCCDSERVFCNSVYFMFLYFILYCGQLLVTGIMALLSSSYFERIKRMKWMNKSKKFVDSLKNRGEYEKLFNVKILDGLY